ncbi:hypothetical protein DdX_00406 [Ditylenchus destructor]|uniref:Uncharacterized protein n=1 Tax=Ditylenchus destructor TaxID=166010 RepID=A0AAD4RD70_9BILA|nr:hypothetical protein DdX_00406 [Ditylenchus destructor]
MNGIKLIALISLICVLYTCTNVGADPDPKKKVKDTSLGSTISNLLPPGEVKDAFDKLEMKDVMDTMELLGQAYKFDNIDQFLGKLFEKNPEAANFVKLLLDKMGCPKDDASKNCMPQLQKIKQALKSILDPLSSFKDQIMAALMAMLQVMQNAVMASTIMQVLTG